MKHHPYSKIKLKKEKIDQICNLDLLLESEFTYCTSDLLTNNSLLLEHYDPENLHQFRVTLRRLKSLLRFFKKEIPRREWKKANHIIELLIKPTSKVRDYDVFNANYIIPAFRENHASVERKNALNASNEKLTTLHEDTINTLSSKGYRQRIDELHNWATGHKWNSKSGSCKKLEKNKFRSLVEKRLNKKFNKLARRTLKLNHLDKKNLHKLRIEAKELRYLIDIFRLYVKKSKRHLNKLKNLQNNLGIVNDTYIAEQLMQELNAANYFNATSEYIKQQTYRQRAHCLESLNSQF